MVYFVVTAYFGEEKANEDYLKYIKEVKPIVNKYGGRYLIRSENITALSSEWNPNRVIIIEFDTKKQLNRCFESAEYKKISYLREKSVNCKAIIIE